MGVKSLAYMRGYPPLKIDVFMGSVSSCASFNSLIESGNNFNRPILPASDCVTAGLVRRRPLSDLLDMFGSAAMADCAQTCF